MHDRLGSRALVDQQIYENIFQVYILDRLGSRALVELRTTFATLKENQA